MTKLYEIIILFYNTFCRVQKRTYERHRVFFIKLIGMEMKNVLKILENAAYIFVKAKK